MYTAFMARRTGTSDYRLVINATPAKVQVQLRRVVSGTETTLTNVVLSGAALTADETLQVKFRVSGTTLQGKVWRSAATEPTAWTTTATDSTPSLQGAGAVGIYGYLSGSATNGPITHKIAQISVKPV